MLHLINLVVIKVSESLVILHLFYCSSVPNIFIIENKLTRGIPVCPNPDINFLESILEQQLNSFFGKHISLSVEDTDLKSPNYPSNSSVQFSHSLVSDSLCPPKL